MKDFPSCFGENGVQIIDSSSSSFSKTAQNLVTCVYQCKLRRRLCFIIINWTKHLMGQGLSLQIDNSANQCLCKVDLKPWLFSKKKGCKNLEIESSKMEIYWDLSNAKFGSGPEPQQGFFVAIVYEKEMIFLIGDLEKQAWKKIDSDSIHSISKSKSKSIYVARREHIFGKKFYCAKAQFCDKGQTHNLSIECDTIAMNDPSLVIRIDSKTAMQIKRLKWKFRGNQTILIDGIQVEVFWDVHNWLFGNAMGNAVFMFQTRLQIDKSILDSPHLNCSNSNSNALVKDSGLDFSLILYAWRSE